MKINHSFQLLARDYNARFQPATVERHWRKAQKALLKRMQSAK